jgi:predicted HicB family RNase H-like nuclease
MKKMETMKEIIEIDRVVFNIQKNKILNLLHQEVDCISLSFDFGGSSVKLYANQGQHAERSYIEMKNDDEQISCYAGLPYE